MSTPLRPISEAARITGCSERTLRDWENLGLITPQRDTTGRRLYDDKDLEQLKRIKNRPRKNRAQQTAHV